MLTIVITVCLVFVLQLAQLVSTGIVILLGVDGVTILAKRFEIGTLELYATLHLHHRRIVLVNTFVAILFALASAERPMLCVSIGLPLYGVAILSHRISSVTQRNNKYDLHAMYCRRPRVWPLLLYLMLITVCGCWHIGTIFMVASGGLVWRFLCTLPVQISPKMGIPEAHELIISLLVILTTSMPVGELDLRELL